MHQQYVRTLTIKWQDLVVQRIVLDERMARAAIRAGAVLIDGTHVEVLVRWGISSSYPLFAFNPSMSFIIVKEEDMLLKGLLGSSPCSTT